MKKYNCFGVSVKLVLGICLLLILTSEVLFAQPFLNSLAVLFRARPPWPTIYPTGSLINSPSSTFNQQKVLPMPSALMASASTSHGQQGILIAHPLSNTKAAGSTNPAKIQFLPQFQSQSKFKSKPSFFSHSINSGSLGDAQNQKSHFAPNPMPTTLSPSISHFRFPDLPSPPIFQSLSGNNGQTHQTPTHFSNSPWQKNENFEVTSGSQLNKVQIFHPPKSIPTQREVANSKPNDFRPSPRLEEFGNRVFENDDSSNKKLSSFAASDAKNPPRFETGFKPISYHQYAAHYGTTASREIYTNSHTQWNQHPPPLTPPPPTTTISTTLATLSSRDDRKIITAEVSRSVVSAEASVEEVRKERVGSVSVENYQTSFTVTPSSTEIVEDWIKPTKTQRKVKGEEINSLPGRRTQGNGSHEQGKSKFPVYTRNKNKNVRMRPSKCEKFHRYGFCPVTHHYPLSQVEKIASRCSALLTHLIAPLPKTEVHYDIVVTRNESRRGSKARPRVAKSKGWSWRNYKGRPVCDTEEVKITPGWAKDEGGEWLVILQTEIWKQEAQISVCSFAHESESCAGMHCFQTSSTLGTKCVQRFTAQRLAVLDPGNEERCPVMRAVFLPSACVCLSEVGRSSEESAGVGSVLPEASSEEKSPAQGEGGVVGRRRRLGPTTMPNTGLLFPLLVENGTFTTTVLVSEKITSSDMESSTSSASTNVATP